MSKTITSLEQYKIEYAKSINNPAAFWEEKANNFTWHKKWDSVLEWDFTKPEIKWFEGGKLNITENCLDRHLKTKGEQTAIKWIANNPNEQSRCLSYNELHTEICKFANVLKNNDAKKGDRICLYMPMVPELAIAVLACARIGAIHSVVFAGFSSKSLSDRINDADCSILITADGGFRGEKITPLKEISDTAMQSTPSIEKCIVLERTKSKITMQNGRDVWWHEQMQKYEYLIDLGKDLATIKEQYKIEDNLIKGCQSRVWLHAEHTDGKIIFTADSDAIMTKGIIAILITVLSGQSPQNIADAKLDFINEIGLKDQLSPTRANGLVSMIKQMKIYALAFSK